MDRLRAGRIHRATRARRRTPSTTAAQKEGAEFAKLVMSHVDCDTIPFFWQYANRFTIFDNIFATEDTPSTPNAIAMIAGPVGRDAMGRAPGETLSTRPQTADRQRHDQRHDLYRHGARRRACRSSTTRSRGGARRSTLRPRNRQPTSAKESWAPSNTAVNLTFATVPLTLAGNERHHADGGRPQRRGRSGRHPDGHPLHPGAIRTGRSAGAGIRTATTPSRTSRAGDHRASRTQLRLPPQRRAIFRLYRQQHRASGPT